MYTDNQSYVCVLDVCMYPICQVYLNKAKEYSVYKNLNNGDLKFKVCLQAEANHICQVYLNKAKKYSVFKNLNNDDLKFEVRLQAGANCKQQLFHKPKNTSYLCNTNLS